MDGPLGRNEIPGALPMTTRLTAVLERRHWLFLSIVVVPAHILALWSFGATFWVDATVYVGLGDCLFSPEKMRAFYDATGMLVFSHITPGEPVIWACARLLPVEARWPAIAIAQQDRKSTRLNSSHLRLSRMPSSA